jgi:hypothetical protein
MALADEGCPFRRRPNALTSRWHFVPYGWPSAPLRLRPGRNAGAPGSHFRWQRRIHAMPNASMVIPSASASIRKGKGI